MVENDKYVISNFSEFESFLSGIGPEIGDPHGINLVYRGQVNSEWGLETSAARKYDTLQHERGTVGRFKMKAGSRHSNLPALLDYASWLFLMQHYGLPTRVLDWTESALVALYFAIEDQIYDKNDGAIWILFPEQMKISIGIDPTIRAAVLAETIRTPFETVEPDPNHRLRADFIHPFESNPRMHAQHCAFTVHGGWPINQLDKLPGAQAFLRKATVPASEKQRLRRMLYRLGIRRSTLFPDLENLARDLAHFRFL